MDSIKVGDIYNILDDFAPFATQEEFDNSCLVVGRYTDCVKGVLIALDVTRNVITEAINNNCNLIVCHHPILFAPYKRITDCDYATSVVLFAIENKINIIAAHTNFDVAIGGINDRLAALLKGNNIKMIDKDKYARVFDIAPCLLYDYAKGVRRLLNDNTVSVIGKNAKIDKVCVVGGSGGSEELIKYCKNNDAVLLTADVKHNLAVMAEDIGTKVIVVGHFTSEKIFVTIVREILSKGYPLLKMIESKKNDNPYRLHEE